jgi:hypothetical protein
MTMPTSVLNIEVSKEVDYQNDEDDLHLFATNPDCTTANPPKNFFVVTLIGDIVTVNGQHVKGTYVGRTRVIKASPAPAPGGAIADVNRTAMREHIFEILNASGRQIGTIMSTGFSGGQSPPGTGTPNEHANWAIVGGTGAYLGARGQVRGLGATGRAASMMEDPALRRETCHFSPGSVHFVLRIIPMNAPEITAAAMGPLIFTGPNHSLVTEFNRAMGGHNVRLFATGLGPTFPDVDLEQAFPITPQSVVDSPVAVTVDGSLATNVHAFGIPGTVNAYQVDFIMPPAITPGQRPIRLKAAWIDGPVSTIWAG